MAAAGKENRGMQIGMIGLGRMGSDMVRRLLAAGHECVVYDLNQGAVEALAAEGATGTGSLKAFVEGLSRPRAIWIMLPAAVVEQTLGALGPGLSPGDIVIDGGNSHFQDDIRRCAEFESRGVQYLDVGTSGGVWGRERGYCLMIGGEPLAVQRLDPIFASLAPGLLAARRTPGRGGAISSAEQGYLHCGPSGAGHFVKMIHNGVEYGLMASLAEGFNILRHADAGKLASGADAETAPVEHGELYRYDFDLPEIAELWRRGSVVSSWLLDLCARALLESPGLDGFQGRVSDSGEGRWTVQAAIDEGVPAYQLSAALFSRFASRGEADFGDRLLSALRHQFGGHGEKGPQREGGAS
jgi:6-phosphogluconate dehydrogenase